MNTREYAVELRKAADFLDTRPAFELESYEKGTTRFTFWDKALFVAAAKALGNAKKEYTPYDDLRLTSTQAKVVLSIARDKVCRKIVTFECDPLFTPEEEKELEGDAAAAVQRT
jgi:hypothetical protein